MLQVLLVEASCELALTQLRSCQTRDGWEQMHVEADACDASVVGLGKRPALNIRRDALGCGRVSNV